jgi:hypothetical protein
MSPISTFFDMAVLSRRDIKGEPLAGGSSYTITGGLPGARSSAIDVGVERSDE